MNKVKHRVYITGVSNVLPTGVSNESLWQSTLSGISAISSCKSQVEQGNHSKWYGRVDNEFTARASKLLPKKIRRLCCKPSLWGLMAAQNAVEEANLDLNCVSPGRCGLFVASEGDHVQLFENSTNLSLRLVKHLQNNLLSTSKNYFQFKGECKAFGLTEGSAIAALDNAMSRLQQGHIDFALVICAGKQEEVLNLSTQFESTQLSNGQHGPKSLQPYDSSRDGMIMGEGAVAIVLESEKLVRKRGITPLAELINVSFYINLSGKYRDYNAYSKCLENILSNARIKPIHIGAICSDGKGLPTGDLLELRLLEHALGPVASEIPITCLTPITGVISSTGLCLQLILCIEMLKRQTVPPIAHLENPEFTPLKLCQNYSETLWGNHAVAFNTSLSRLHSAALIASV